MNLPKPGRIIEIVKLWGKIIFLQTFERNGRSDEFLLYGVPAGMEPVIVFAVTEDSCVIGQREFRYGANAVVLETPGGCAKAGQAVLEVAERELREETGYEARELVQLGEPCWFEPAALRVRYTPILALGCRKVAEPEREPNEVIETVLIPLDDWLGMCEDGTIADDKTVMVTVRALPHLGYAIRKVE